MQLDTDALYKAANVDAKAPLLVGGGSGTREKWRCGHDESNRYIGI